MLLRGFNESPFQNTSNLYSHFVRCPAAEYAYKRWGFDAPDSLLPRESLACETSDQKLWKETISDHMIPWIKGFGHRHFNK